MAKPIIRSTTVAAGALGASMVLSRHQAEALSLACTTGGACEPRADEAVARRQAAEAIEACRFDRGRDTRGGATAFTQVTIDVTLAARIRTLLLVSNKSSGKAIAVESKDGVVSLTGTVRSEVAKEFAERIAQSATGVKSVRNRLVVNAG